MRILFFALSFFLQIMITNAQVRGVWVTNVASDALTSREKIKECVQICKASGFTDIFMVTYNNAKTMYRSKIMDSLWGYAIDSKYGSRDPLQEMIEEAHAQGLKVHAWFEFGFSSSYDAKGGIIVQKKPHWAAITNEGKLATKNKFDWLNAFHPEVQQYMKSLLLEVVRNYNVDGVQGDDRLPANPSTAGYDSLTVAIYKAQHNNQPPPKDYKNAAWLQWRSDLLTNFLGQLYTDIKKIKPNVLVTMAPSIYPWSKEEYLQDWPTWVQKGYVDQVFPQVYRYNFEAYKATLTAMTKQLTAKERAICFPGVLQSLGNGYLANDTLMRQMIAENRVQGYSGEVFFYFDGIKKKAAWFAKVYQKFNNQNSSLNIATDPKSLSTSLSIKQQKAILDVLKDIPSITVTFINKKAVFYGTANAATRMKLMQATAANKVIADLSNVKTINQ